MLWKSKLLVPIFILCTLAVGCTKPHYPLFVEVVQDHNKITSETLVSVKSSIIDAAAEKDLDTDGQEAINDLIERLDAIINGSEAIHDYVMTETVDEGLFQQLLQSRWRRY